MKHITKRKGIAVALLAFLVFSSCANTIPSRVQNAIPIHPTAVYPIKVFVFPFVDKRIVDQKISPRRITWPNSKGSIDYYGEKVEEGLTEAIADYLTASRLFHQADMINLVVSSDLLKSKGYRALLTADIEGFSAGFSVPKLVLGLAVMPNPLFFILPGITLLPLAIWPKEMRFDAVLSNVRLKDLRTGQIVWTGRAEVHKLEKKAVPHITAQWYLGEMGELVAKELVQKFQNAGLEFK